MFGFLKKKITDFVGSLTKREEAKEEPAPKGESAKEEAKPIPVSEPKEEPVRKEEPAKKKEQAARKEPVKEKAKEIPKPEPKPVPVHLHKEPKEKPEGKNPEPKPPEKPEATLEKPAVKEGKKHLAEERPSARESREEELWAKEQEEILAELEEEEKGKQAEAPKPVKEKARPVEELGRKTGPPTPEKKIHAPPGPVREAPKESKPPEPTPGRKESKPEAPKPAEDKKVKLSWESKIFSLLSPEVEIKEKDLADLLDNFELSLLESDVAYSVAQEIVAEMRENLVGRKIRKKDLDAEIRNAIRTALVHILTSTPSFDLLARVKTGSKPYKIMFLGPNGAGKTTTIAKVCRLLQQNGLSVVFAAADTFRAAAIEQMEVHAQRLNVPIIKSNYGADPASVAYDAVNKAKKEKIDVVLIDTAGRQETNRNLIDELRKINRVVQPDLKLYIGESIAGNAVIDQLGSFHEAVTVDGVILTKLDCDAKGGTAFSVTKATGVPIVYFGVGQNYSDLQPFDAQTLVDAVFA